MVGAYDKGGPETIITEVQKRLAEKGWKEVRMALSTTVRFVFSFYWKRDVPDLIFQWNSNERFHGIHNHRFAQRGS
jgi:hypothetical protein